MKKYKKFLIELFKSRIELSGEISQKYFEENNWPSIEFYSDLNQFIGGVHRNITKCEMCIYTKSEIFYLTFNSITVEISWTEYKHLKEIVTRKKKEQLENEKNISNKKDEEMLNNLFFTFMEQQKRKTLTEKTQINI